MAYHLPLRLAPVGQLDVEKINADNLPRVLALHRKVADAGKQLVEVVGATVWILEPCIVNREALDKILAQMRVCPLPELRPANTPDPKPNGKDLFQVIVDDLVPLAICGSCKVRLYN